MNKYLNGCNQELETLLEKLKKDEDQMMQETGIMRMRECKDYLYKDCKMDNFMGLTPMKMEKINEVKTEKALETLNLNEFRKIVSSLDYDAFILDIFKNTYGLKENTADKEKWEMLKRISGKAMWIVDIRINELCRREKYGTFIVNVFKRMGYPIVIYCSGEAQSYWIKIGFKMVVPNVFIWEQNK